MPRTSPSPSTTDLRGAATALALAIGAALPALAADAYVAPVRIELRAGALNETVDVMNRASTRLRMGVKLMEWTQDAEGNDVYTDTTDLVYFPRQLDLEAQARRQVRIGAKTPAGAVERAYRLFIEEQPEPASDANRAQVAVLVRFGVPVFLRPATPRAEHEILPPALAAGKLSVAIRNTGNQHLRVLRLKVEDGAGFSREIPGWYTLAGAQRTFSTEIPRDVCRKARTFTIAIEGEAGLRADRKLDVDPARCG